MAQGLVFFEDSPPENVGIGQESKKFDVFLAGLMPNLQMPDEFRFLPQKFSTELTLPTLAPVNPYFVNCSRVL